MMDKMIRYCKKISPLPQAVLPARFNLSTKKCSSKNGSSNTWAPSSVMLAAQPWTYTPHTAGNRGFPAAQQLATVPEVHRHGQTEPALVLHGRYPSAKEASPPSPFIMWRPRSRYPAIEKSSSMLAWKLCHLCELLQHTMTHSRLFVDIYFIFFIVT